VQRTLAIDYADYQGVIHGVLPASRRPGGPGQRYARSLSLDGSSRDAIAIAASDRDIAAILYHGRRSAPPGRRRRGSWTERWVALNFTARWRHGTVEFRQHSGTVNARKIVAWARFCVAMVEAARKNPTIVSGGRVVANPARFGLDESGRRRTFVRLITSPEGTTREDVFRETGWRRGSLTMRRFAQEAGLEIFRQRRQDNGHVRYWARPVDQSAAPIAAADAAPKTLDTLVAVLELSPEDAEYWRSRSRFFAGGGGNDIPDEG
ncbi:MAG TPA: amidoligase family protein, partial [Thermoanaerobaculia bacterium]|nr:amidoligase family protein [Thermoanaerobaculia bacterium]